MRCGIAVCLLAVLCGCNPAPKYTRPPTPAPAAFKESAGWVVAKPGDDKIRSKWWEIYNDPQLNALEEQVQISNQTIKVAEANFRGSRALVAEARSALFPALTGSGSYTNSRFSSTARTAAVIPGANSGTTGFSGSSSLVNTFSLPFDLSYTVDLWHRVRNTIAADAFQAQASAADVATALLSTQAELAHDYFEVRALDTQRAILRDTLENYRRSLDLTKTLYKAGLDSDEEVAQAQTQLDIATAQATDLGVARAQFEHAIAMLTGKPPAEFTLAVAPFVPKPPAVPVAVPSELLQRRPDIAAAERHVAAANAQIGIARAAYYPNLLLNATGGLETAHFTQWFNWPSRFWSVGPQLAETLFDAGARRALNQQVRASYDAAVASYRQTVLGAFQATEDNLSALRILAQEAEQQHTAVASSSHYLDLSMTRFRAGVDSYLNVITAQNAVLKGRETEVQIALRRMTASVSLVMALGGGWDDTQLPQMKDLLSKR